MASSRDELFAVDVQKRGGLQTNLARGGLALPQSPSGGKPKDVNGRRCFKKKKKERDGCWSLTSIPRGGGGIETKSRFRATSHEAT